MLFWRDDMYLFSIIVLFSDHHLSYQFMELLKEISGLSNTDQLWKSVCY